MGLIVPQTVRIRTNGMTCKHYREKGYEFEKCGDIIEVDVFDLPKGSGTKVKIICDICGKEAEICYGDVIKCNKENELITCGSNSCKNKKYILYNRPFTFYFFSINFWKHIIILQ